MNNNLLSWIMINKTLLKYNLVQMINKTHLRKQNHNNHNSLLNNLKTFKNKYKMKYIKHTIMLVKYKVNLISLYPINNKIYKYLNIF